MDQGLRSLCSALVLIFSLAACSATGDFGRTYSPQPSFLDQRPGQTRDGQFDLLRASEETRMENATARFMSTTDSTSWLARIRQAARSATGVQTSETDYFKLMRSKRFGAPETRYASLSNDIQLDNMTLPEAFRAICAVQTLDQRRQTALEGVPGTDEQTRAALARRREENRARIAEFAAMIEFRYNSYSYALEQLLVETPAPAARDVDARLTRMAVFVNLARNNSYCRND